MNRRGGLGRGLDALIPGNKTPSESELQQLPVAQIEANPHQPRQDFDEEELAGLAESIRTHGILSPLVVSPLPGGERWQLIAGERRLRAARLAGLETVPALVREAGEQQRLELALIENIQRADLKPLETAEAYQRLAAEFGLIHEEIATRVGKSRVAVSNTLRLLTLADEVKQALRDDLISEGHARALLGLANPLAQASALKTVLEKRLNVRQTEELVRLLAGNRPARSPRAQPPAEISELENRLRSALGTRVNLNRGVKGGSLVLYFYSDEELDGLVNRILGENLEDSAV